MWMDKKYETENNLDEHQNLAKVAKWEIFSGTVWEEDQGQQDHHNPFNSKLEFYGDIFVSY